MAKRKRKLTAEQRQRKREHMTIFVHGKQVRVRRPETIEGLSAEEFIRRNADPIWLVQNEMSEYLPQEAEIPLVPSTGSDRKSKARPREGDADGRDDLPF